MRRALAILGVAVLVFVVAGVALALFSKTDDSAREQADGMVSSAPGTEAAGLTTQAGRPVSLQDFEGQARIVNVWATWCPFCKDEIPDFVAAQEELGDEITIILVNRAEPPSTVNAFLDTYDPEGRLVSVLDADDSYFGAIGGFAMPTTHFINEKNEVVLEKRGPLTREEILKRARALVAE